MISKQDASFVENKMKEITKGDDIRKVNLRTFAISDTGLTRSVAFIVVLQNVVWRVCDGD